MSTTSQTLLDAVNTAILTGVTKPGTLSINGRTIQYRSLADLRAIRNDLRKEVRGAGSRMRLGDISG